MVQNNKILTVSYGTFSCTLEGFEDSFSTMKAIAEYFRDLAADDRYFGAEPPQPDTEMLARIAEREIARQVEARRDGNGFVLRAAGIATPAIAADDTEPAVRHTPQAEIEPEVATEPVVEAAPKSASKSAPEAAAETKTEAVGAPAAASQAMTEPDLSVSDQPFAAKVDDTLDMPAPLEPETFEVEDLGAEPDIAPAADSIAAKLQRIRAVVSRNEQAAAAEYEEDYASNMPANAFATAATEEMTQAIEDNAEVKAEDDLDAADNDLAAMLHRLGAVEEAAPAAPEIEKELEAENRLEVEVSVDAETEVEIAAEALIEDQDDAQTEADAGDDVVAETEVATGAEAGLVAAAAAIGLFDDLDAPDDEADLDDEAEPNDDLTNIMGRDQDNETGAPDTDADEGFDDDNLGDEFDEFDDSNDLGDMKDHDRKERPVSALARVVKIKRTDFEAAIASGRLEEIGQDGEPTVGSLSPEEEADLMRELAEVAAELDRSDMPAPDAARSRPTLATSVAEDEADLSRLMDEAGEKLSDPDAAARRESYSHMRAAVATTKAERSAGGTMGSHTSDDPYRDDLASVVRPRRPETSPHRPTRPATEIRPAPLKLVAEQRIDTGGAARGPVHPRRVSTRLLDEPAATDVSTPEGGFAEFAADVGATELPNLLEAAAAYMSFVEGRAQFSRPQLMNKVRQVETGEFNREDGLRSFGQLLRDGKIEKMGGGRFAATGRIGFRPDDERAVG